MRSKTDKLMLLRGGQEGGRHGTTAAAPRGETGQVIYGSVGGTALKSEAAPALEQDGAQALGALAWSMPSGQPSVAEKRSEARMKGYVGEACPECANFTLVRNGTCLKCDTCGSTTGCS